MNSKNKGFLLALAFVGLTTVSLNVALKPAHAQGTPTQEKQQQHQKDTCNKKSHTNQSSEKSSAQNNEQKDTYNKKSRTNQSSEKSSAQNKEQEDSDRKKSRTNQ
ncbi:MAG: hypothetical protein ACRCT1_09250, partial [Microcoleaceae cyanobacterium]